MMATLPGLPMFGHGQIEGYTEKYGMEYRWPRYEEWPDQALVERHEREIAPLLKRLALRRKQQLPALRLLLRQRRRRRKRICLLQSQRRRACRGHLQQPLWLPHGPSTSRPPLPTRVPAGFASSACAKAWAFGDGTRSSHFATRSPASNICAARAISASAASPSTCTPTSAMSFSTGASFPDEPQPWDRLCDRLNGRGVPNLDDELVNLELRPVHDAFRQLMEPGMVHAFADLAEYPRMSASKKIESDRKKFFEQIWARTESFLHLAQAAYTKRRAREGQPPLVTHPTDPAFAGDSISRASPRRAASALIESILSSPQSVPAAARRVLPSPGAQATGSAVWGPILGWCIIPQLAESLTLRQGGEKN